MIKEIKKCRICGNENLVPILSLGNQALTGVFPRSKSEKITSGPMELVKCDEDAKGQYCGLLQLKHSFDLNEMYGDNYGYRSGLNISMVDHLKKKVERVLSLTKLKKDDLVIDIGSNDSTLLQNYPKEGYLLMGIDPTGKKFKQYYPAHIQLIPDFFSAKIVKKNLGDKKAKVVTSIAMFYDLEDPTAFMKEIYDVLDDDGIWLFEQSYMPTMLEKTSYDTICHEHLEYYRLKQIKWMTDRIGFKIIDIDLNSANGGSFAIVVAKKANKNFKENTHSIEQILANEAKEKLSVLEPYKEFTRRTLQHRDNLLKFIADVKNKGEKICGYGASTKGNVILQFCQLAEKDIPCIAEVNKDKFGCFTPGTNIPILSESDVHKMKPQYLLVLPWHFKETIIERERNYLKEGGKLVMPLPEIEVVEQVGLSS